MADNSVLITGIADEAFANEIRKLPPWATESTAGKIQGVLNRMLNLQQKTLVDIVKKINSASAQSGGMTPADAKKANDELGDFVRGLKKANNEFPKEQKRWKDREDQHGKDKKWWQEETALRAVATTALVKFSELMASTVKDSANTFDDLYRSGINVMSGFDQAKDGFQALQQMATLTGIRYTELAATLAKYNTAVNAFGLGRFTKTIGAASKDLTQFGYTTKESADLLGAYLESQKGFSNIRQKTDQEVQQGLVRFGDRITRLSQATGVLRSRLLENIEAISQSVESTILSGQIGADAAQSTTEFIASFKDKNLGQAFLRMMTDAIKPLNETFMDFQKTGFGGFGQELMNFTQSLEGLDPAEAARRTAEFAAANESEIKMMTQRANLLRQAGVKEADGVLKITTGLQQQARAYNAVSADERKRADATAKATADFKNAWGKLLAQFQITFAATIPLLDFFTKILTTFNDGLSAVSNFLKENTIKSAFMKIFTVLPGYLADGFKGVFVNIGQYFQKGFSEIVTDIGNSITDTLKTPLNEIVMILGLLGAALLALKGTVAGKAVVGAIVDKFRVGAAKDAAGAPSRGTSGGVVRGTSGGVATSKTSGPGFLERLGKGIGELGKGIGTGVGKLVQNLLTGLANGLKALGTKEVLFGAANLLALSASLYVTAKAVQEFAKASWEDLTKAGAALTGLALAGRFLGTASGQLVLGGVGLLALSGGLWVIGQALESFMKVSWEDMSKAGVALVGLGLAGAAAGSAAPLILLGAAAFGAMGAALWVIGKAVEVAGPALKTLAEGLAEIGKINGANLIQVATGITSLSASLVAFAAGSAIGGIGGIIGTVSGAFSKLFGDGSLLDQLKSFAVLGPRLQQAGTGVTNLASGLANLSNAMGALKGIDNLKAIVSTVNDLNLAKVSAISAIGNAIGLPTQTPAANVSSPTSPKSSILETQLANATTPSSTKTDVPQGKELSNPISVGIEKTATDNSINSMLGYQNSLLEQLLLSTDTLVSTNKDILRYTRIQS